MYLLYDQLNELLSEAVPVNEAWTSGVSSDYFGNNWIRNDPTPGADSAGAIVTDVITGPPIQDSPFPTPTCQGDTTSVQHWGQSWHVGSYTNGVGVEVQTDNLQAEIAMGVHTNPISPIP